MAEVTVKKKTVDASLAVIRKAGQSDGLPRSIEKIDTLLSTTGNWQKFISVPDRRHAIPWGKAPRPPVGGRIFAHVTCELPTKWAKTPEIR